MLAQKGLLKCLSPLKSFLQWDHPSPPLVLTHVGREIAGYATIQARSRWADSLMKPEVAASLVCFVNKV
jgi:hypothetical protein